MAQVFLSYDREDEAKARAIAAALAKAGHDVWWDGHITGGAQFSREIEEALKRAEAVVVLWSRHSADSAWVRDEAAAGRDTGRLVPVTLDGADPPLGFRQYQTIDLTGRKARAGSPAMRRLSQAIAALGDPSSGATGPSSKAAQPNGLAVPRWALAVALAVLLAAAALLAWRPWDDAHSVPVVAVHAADPAPASRALARDLMIKLGDLQKARTDYLRLTEAKPGADLILEAGSAFSGSQTETSLALVAGKDRSLLWSQQFTGPNAEAGELRHQVAITAARVLACALQALNDKQARLSQPVLKLYLNGCASFDGLAYGELRQMIPIMREVTQKAPQFHGGWGKLIQAEILTSITGPSDPSLIEPLKRDIKASRQFNPHLAEAYLGEVELLPADAYAERLRRLDLAISHNPDHADSFAARAHYLRIVGRMADSVGSAQRAAELNPLSPALQYDYVTALSHAGQFETAQRELELAEKRWPGSSVVADARFRFNLRYGDPRQADRSQQRGATLWTPRLTDAFLKARIAPTQANIDAVIREAEALSRQEPRGLGVLVQALGTFDREREVMPLVLGRPSEALALALSEALFRPYMRELWHDPRSMQIAKHLKLTDYWRSSGKWPDFCFEPDLPYDCKAEAAKLS